MAWNIKNDEALEMLSDASGMTIEDLNNMEEWKFVLEWDRWIGDNSFDGYLDEFIECLINRNNELEMEV